MADRECIMDFIARDKPLAALALDENFETHADRIEATPPPLSSWPDAWHSRGGGASHTVMVYRIESETITILRVLHAAQRWPSAE